MSSTSSIRKPLLPSSLERASSAPPARKPGFHLLVETLATQLGSSAPLPGGPDTPGERSSTSNPATPGASGRTAAELPVLEVPEGISHLSPTREPLALVPRKPSSAAHMLESIESAGRSRLLMVSPAGLRTRLNGQAAPLVVLLQVGDQLQLDPHTILHVTEFRGAGAVSPGPEQLGRLCGVCRIPVEAGTTIYVCSGCGCPLHLEGEQQEGESKPEAERLECAKFGDCPSCGTAVNTSSGHVWEPEL